MSPHLLSDLIPKNTLISHLGLLWLVGAPDVIAENVQRLLKRAMMMVEMKMKNRLGRESPDCILECRNS